MEDHRELEFDTSPIDKKECKQLASQHKYKGLGFFTSAEKFSAGGAGVPLLLSMLEQYISLLFLSSLLSIPIYYYLYQIYQTSGQESHFIYLDVLSYASIYDAMNVNTSNFKLSGATTLDRQFNTDQLPDLISLLANDESIWTQWYTIVAGCTALISLLAMLFHFWFQRAAEQMLIQLDDDLISPSDFSVEVRFRRGCCGCLNDFPFATATLGQLFAFIDRNSFTKFFSVAPDQWKPTEAANLTEQFTDTYLYQNILLNDNSPFDIKYATMVKKFDMLYDMQDLNEKARQIVRTRVMLQNKAKTDPLDAGFDQIAQDTVMDPNNPKLKDLIHDQHETYLDIKENLQGWSKYENLDNLQAIVSFRTQEIREEFEEKVAEMNNQYQFKFQFCNCCAVFPKSLHQHTSDNEQQRIDVNRAPGEPEDFIWENIQVHPCERGLRFSLVIIGILIILILSAIGQVWFRSNYLVVSMVIIISNLLVVLFVISTIESVRSQSRATKQLNQVLLMTLPIFLNMVIFPFVLNIDQNMNSVVQNLIKDQLGETILNKIKSDTFNDIDKTFQMKFCTQILLTQIIQSIVPILSTQIHNTIVDLVNSIKMSSEYIYTNDEWFDQQKGPEFDFEQQLSHFLTSLATCLVQAPVMPMMIPVTLMGVLIQYTIIKSNLVQIFRTPQVKEASVQFGAYFINIILVFNLIIATLSFSNEQFFCIQEAQCKKDTGLFTLDRIYSGNDFQDWINKRDPHSGMKAISSLTFNCLLVILLLTISFRPFMSRMFRQIFQWPWILLLRYLVLYPISLCVSCCTTQSKNSSISDHIDDIDEQRIESKKTSQNDDVQNLKIKSQLSEEIEQISKMHQNEKDNTQTTNEIKLNIETQGKFDPNKNNDRNNQYSLNKANSMNEGNSLNKGNEIELKSEEDEDQEIEYTRQFVNGPIFTYSIWENPQQRKVVQQYNDMIESQQSLAISHYMSEFERDRSTKRDTAKFGKDDYSEVDQYLENQFKDTDKQQMKEMNHTQERSNYEEQDIDVQNI